AGVGYDEGEAAAPAIIELSDKRRILVFALGSDSSGVPLDWAATHDRPGVNLLLYLSLRKLDDIARLVAAHKIGGDVVVMSIHWGSNWDYSIAASQRAFAH